jgi:hypothetical protein
MGVRHARRRRQCRSGTRRRIGISGDAVMPGSVCVQARILYLAGAAESSPGPPRAGGRGSAESAASWAGLEGEPARQ